MLNILLFCDLNFYKKMQEKSKTNQNSQNNSKSSKSSKTDEKQRSLDYFRLRIQGIIKERLEWLKNLEGINIANEVFHEKEWELSELTDKITQIQESLIQSNIALNKERNRIITFNNEIEKFKLKSKDDRSRMIQLLQFAEPIENSKVTFFDRRPESGIKKEIPITPKTIYNNKNNFKRSMSYKKCGTTRSKNKNLAKTYNDYTRTNRKCPNEMKQNIVKTIMFPNNSNEDNIDEEYKCLQKHKEELKAIYDNMILKLNEEDKLRDEEMRLQTNNMNSHLNDLSKRNNYLKNQNYNLTKNYMDLNYDTKQNSNKLNDQTELTKLQNETLKNNLNDIIQKAKMDKAINKKEYDRRTRQVANNLRNRVKTKEETANLAKRQYSEVQKMYEDKIDEVRSKYDNLEKKYLMLKKGRKILNEDEYEEDEENNDTDEIEDKMKLYRTKLKEFESYINDIKGMTQGDYDHYNNINEKTEENKEQFMKETEMVDYQLQELLFELKRKQNENERFVENINAQFEEGNEGQETNQGQELKIIEEERQSQII